MTTTDTVMFRLVDRREGDYPQPNPMTEYYTESTVLHFKKEVDLVRDWLWLKRRSEEPFDSLLVTEDVDTLESIAGELKVPFEVEAIFGLYIIKVPAGVRPPPLKSSRTGERGGHYSAPV